MGDAFRLLQEQRHKADYDPFHRATRADALTVIATAETAIANLRQASNQDRIAFAALLLFRNRS